MGRSKTFLPHYCSTSRLLSSLFPIPGTRNPQSTYRQPPSGAHAKILASPYPSEKSRKQSVSATRRNQQVCKSSFVKFTILTDHTDSSSTPNVQPAPHSSDEPSDVHHEGSRTRVLAGDGLALSKHTTVAIHATALTGYAAHRPRNSVASIENRSFLGIALNKALSHTTQGKRILVSL